MIEYTNKNPTFSKSIIEVETGDRMTAVNNNAAPEQLLQNDLVLLAVFDTELVYSSFKKVFPGIQIEEETNSMSLDEITDALSTEWNGESSDNPYAMKSDEITDALSTEWNGESSDNPYAMKSDEITSIIK